MTCAETRRQLPAPDQAVAGEVAAHLLDCVPCRAESDALKEVDRRLQRLAQHREGGALLALKQLDRQMQDHLGRQQPTRPAARWPWLLWLFLLVLAILIIRLRWR